MAHLAMRISGYRRARSSTRRAAPVGFRRPRSQLATVTVGMFSRAAKMGWLTLSFRRMERTCVGVSALTGGGSGAVVVRSVSFCPILSVETT